MSNNYLKDFFKNLIFNEEKHQYFVDKKKLTNSVSDIVNKFSESFKKNEISKSIAKRDNKPVEEILKEWEDKKNESIIKGNQIHKFAEEFVKNNNIKPQNIFNEAIIRFYNNLPEEVVPILTEYKMYHKKYLFGGTADVIFYDKRTDSFSILDYKTNKDLFKNYKGKKLLKPFDNLLDTPFNKYQIQLSFYQILFEQLDYKIDERRILWIKPNGIYKIFKTKDLTNILIDYLKNES